MFHCQSMPSNDRLSAKDFRIHRDALEQFCFVHDKTVTESSRLFNDVTIQRPPSFINLTVLEDLCLGHTVADVMVILGSVDIVMGEVDR